MEPTETTELMSGTMGTSTSGAMRMTRRVVEPEAVARSTMTRLAPPRVQGEGLGERFGIGVFRAQQLGIDGDQLYGSVAAGGGRAEGAELPGPLIARAEEEGEQPVGRRVDQENALAARGQGTAKGGDHASLSYAASQREHGQHWRARGAWSLRRRLDRSRGALKHALERIPARSQPVARALQRVLRRLRNGLRSDVRTGWGEPCRAGKFSRGSD